MRSIFGAWLGPRKGTRHKIQHGAGVNMAIAAGAMPYGNWSGCHSVAWDVNASIRRLIHWRSISKHNYPYGGIVNLDGDDMSMKG